MMQQTTKRIMVALIGALGITIFMVYWGPRKVRIQDLIAYSIVFICFGNVLYRWLCSGDLNQVEIVLQPGEDLIGRTTKNYFIRDSSWTWFIKRGPLPFGYSAIVTTRRVLFYWEDSWYHEIWFKKLIAIEWGENQRINFRFLENGSERSIGMSTWGSNDLLLELLSKGGKPIAEKKKTTATGDA